MRAKPVCEEIAASAPWAKMVRHSRYVIFQTAEAAVPRILFREILARIRQLRFLAIPARPGSARRCHALKRIHRVCTDISPNGTNRHKRRRRTQAESNTTRRKGQTRRRLLQAYGGGKIQQKNAWPSRQGECIMLLCRRMQSPRIPNTMCRL